MFKLAHINLVARDIETLADFYVTVFNCTYLRGPLVLSDEKVGKGNGLPNSELRSVWLNFADSDTPFLELHEHSVTVSRGQPAVNEPGFGHLSFKTTNLDAAISSILDAGGSQVGEVVDFGPAGKPFLIAYMRDPEGNLLELEHPFDERA